MPVGSCSSASALACITPSSMLNMSHLHMPLDNTEVVNRIRELHGTSV